VPVIPVLSRLVRRWGARVVGLAVTAIGLYVVFPGLLTLFGSWPSLRDVAVWWFVVLVALVGASMASLWWLTRLALMRRTGPDGAWSTVSWGTAASAHLAGNAAGKVVPGGPATAGVVQARLLIQSGQPPGEVASAITAMGLLTTGILLMLPVLTIPALLIGPPPARQLELGLVVSLAVAVLMVALSAAILVWTPFVVGVGRVTGRVLHLVNKNATADSVSRALVASRDRVAASFRGRRTRAIVAAAGNRMFDFAALVAALAALGAHARPSEVMMAYAVAQALALIPITPGGLGFVESGLTTLLVLIGVSADQAVVATLLYRLIAFWMPIPFGALAWTGWRINLHLRRHTRTQSEAEPGD
jgi:putative heme transporter